MAIRTRLVAVLIIMLITSAWFAAANPFNLFVQRSAKFSMETFLSIAPGTRIDDAITKLGEPIKVARSRYDLGCPGCATYYFLGEPPPWLPSFQEAWLIVDTRGRVVAVILNSEP